MIPLIVSLLLAGPRDPYPWPCHVVRPPIAMVDAIEVVVDDDPAPACLPCNESCEFPDGKP